MSKMFLPDEKICLRDVVGDSLDVSNAPTAATGGLISPILGVVTAFMAAETIKVLTGASDKVERRLMVFDLWQTNGVNSTLLKIPNARSVPVNVIQR